MTKLLVTLLLVAAFLVAVGCAEPEEDWTHAETYLDCFFGAYQPYLDSQIERNDEAIAEAVTHARKQCHVPSRGALRGAEEWGTEIHHTCIVKAGELMAENHGDQIDLDRLGGWHSMLASYVCSPEKRTRPHLDGPFDLSNGQIIRDIGRVRGHGQRPELENVP